MNLSYSNDKQFKLNNLCFCYEYRKYPGKNKFYCEVLNIINKNNKYMYKFVVYNMNDDVKLYSIMTKQK